jgi:hypothetical protein
VRKSKGFKKISFEDREDLLKLPNVQLKVWLGHYLRSDKNDEVQISNSQLARECDLNEQTVKLAKKALREGGHLETIAESVRDEDNQWTIPTIRVHSAPRVENQPHPQDGEPTYGPRVEFPSGGKPTRIVDTQIQEDTGGSDPLGLRVDTEEDSLSFARSLASAQQDGAGETDKPISKYAVLLHNQVNPDETSKLPEYEKMFRADEDHNRRLFNKTTAFMIWMKANFPGKILGFADFDFHWLNRSENPRGFRHQFEAFYEAANNSRSKKDLVNLMREDLAEAAFGPAEMDMESSGVVVEDNLL